MNRSVEFISSLWEIGYFVVLGRSGVRIRGRESRPSRGGQNFVRRESAFPARYVNLQVVKSVVQRIPHVQVRLVASSAKPQSSDRYQSARLLWSHRNPWAVPPILDRLP